ncbi:MAG: M28 family peptidase, partial [Nitrospinaceae bacterium]|nr:M28 family peptidase [Nitrospinaceae bacterium]NIR55584.1 M28 family peptidase [Nitrospinaceae bacterium]NIS86018.1 M28 family peptidase [Nitrospinaceae bacterium]NIT82864.1 M28 family peptidase [Nitrospinaceae bacterium]NIU45066.1 M28 family peptidase [Nitrospinaceae bacterium]
GTTPGRPVLIGTHYDTRPYADEEPDSRLHSRPILGANDGGSGTAVLLGLAEFLHHHPPSRPVHLVFFDGEDFGPKNSGVALLGSTQYARRLVASVDQEQWPYCVLVVDMVGDRDLQIYRETNSLKSAPWLVDILFQAAREKKLPQFRDKVRYTIYDDHYPFIKIGIPSALLIDFDYPPWHTLEDTLEKCTPESLFAVFSVVVEALGRI